MKLKNLSPLFILSILILGISGCAEKSIEQPEQQTEIKSQQEKKNSTTDSEITTSNIDTSEWKTYRNEKWNYVLKYPEYANIIDGGPSEEVRDKYSVNGDAVLYWINSENKECLICINEMGYGPPFELKQELEKIKIAGNEYDRINLVLEGTKVSVRTKFPYTINDIQDSISISMNTPSEECLTVYEKILTFFKLEK
ncbi:hypothetical protein GF382_03450 [Candidatus Falkowbacteria bacterium]|nr:hypothetical protein [Candidatus Falkowbacteria bacterium]